jgi:hypothetical protein
LRPDAAHSVVVQRRWYNGSEIRYYRQALADNGYLYDARPIRDLSTDLPVSLTLNAYDVVSGPRRLTRRSDRRRSSGMTFYNRATVVC